ncbi:restriction endonuclease subunit S [Streptomyces sp. NPDC012485]|uniref:restriction endonuclease subunit S n=1 Tax=Streptomyces sp. NPDC012485 TaxID=3156673 RepID=UPI003456C270
MKTRKIGTLTEKISTWNPSKSDSREQFTYIDLGSVDQKSKNISDAELVWSNEAPSRARQLVKVGDVLVSTVRPNLNGVARVPVGMDGATASTGFCVLRPTDELDPSYLFHWVRSPLFISEMAHRASGQSYPAVSDRIVKDSLIPLPEIREQRRIAQILDLVDVLRVKRRKAIALLEDLAQSVFFEMFGNVVSNDRHWPPGRVADLVEKFTSGKSLAAAEEDGPDVRYRILKVSAVTSGRFDADESKPAPTGYAPPPSHVVRDGDLLFSRANTEALIGATALVSNPPNNLLLPDKLWRFSWRVDRPTHPLYVRQLFLQGEFRREVSRRASGTSGSMKNISQPKVLSIGCGIPPLELQRQYGRRVEVVEKLANQQRAHLAELDALFASLQHGAFRGELGSESVALLA